MHEADRWYGTTVVGVKKGASCAIAGDGQVTLGETIIKGGSRKVRTLSGGIVAGFAGSTADAFTLFDRFEEKLETYRNQLVRAAVELARDWRQDRVLRRLEAMLLVTDGDHLLLVSGNGDVLEPDDGVAVIGSGGGYALAAARAMLNHTDLGPEEVAREAIRLASEICVYTNDRITVLTAQGSEGRGRGREGP